MNMANNGFVRLIVSALFFFFSAPLAFAGSEFYWKPSYGRGVGTVKAPDCNGKQYDAGLCYNACKSGYSSGGPVCWEQNAKFIPKSYGRGVGTPPAYSCGSKEEDAGLCYTKCSPGYKGVGPVCWALSPPGYIECGAGFAANELQCTMVTGSQTASIGMLGLAAMPAASIAANRALQSKAGTAAVEAAQKLAKLMEPLTSKLAPMFTAGAKNPGKFATVMSDAQKLWVNFFAKNGPQIKELVKVARAVKGSASAGVQSMDDQLDPIEGLRFVFTILSVVDQTPVSGLISSFAYSVYEPASASGAHRPAPGATTPPPPAPVVNSWNYLYGLQGNGDLWAFRMDAGGAIGFSGKIGQGWGDMKLITAGNTGELFAVATNGDLYFYQHDDKLTFTVSAKKIGQGWGRMKSVFSGGTHGNQRILFAINESGELLDCRFEGPDVRNVSVKTIGWGWGGYRQVSAGPNGAIYAINDRGELMKYAYNLADMAQTPKSQGIGPGWDAYPQAFAGADGYLYGLDRKNNLLVYRDQGSGGFLGPQTIGNGFGLRSMTAMKKW